MNIYDEYLCKAIQNNEYGFLHYLQICSCCKITICSCVEKLSNCAVCSNAFCNNCKNKFKCNGYEDYCNCIVCNDCDLQSYILHGKGV